MGRTIRITHGWVGLLIALSWLPLSAQSPADRTGLLAWRDSLHARSSLPPLEAMDRGGEAASDGLRNLRRGLYLIRKGELGDSRGPLDDAIREFELAIDRSPKDWPWPWYGVALAKLALFDRKFVVKATNTQPNGTSYRRGAIDDLGRALEADSTFIPAGALLSRVIATSGNRMLPYGELDMVRLAAKARGADPHLFLVMARMDRDQERYEVAAVDLQAFLDHGGDPAVGRLELARVLAMTGRMDDAVAGYFAGAGQMGEEGRVAYRQDLSWVANDVELITFDSTATDSLGLFVRRFWTSRDALSLRTPDERVREHLRRWAYVHQHFRMHRPVDEPALSVGLTDMDVGDAFADRTAGYRDSVMTEVAFGIPRFVEYRRNQWEVDDRGVIYMRHGEPDQRASYHDKDAPPNESWAYNTPDGRLVFHFLGSGALGASQATTLVAALPLDPNLLNSRAGLDPRLAMIGTRLELNAAAQAVNRNFAERGVPPVPSSGGIPRLPASMLAKMVAEGRAAIATGVTTDGFPLRFDSSMDAIVQLYGVGLLPEEHRRLLVVFGIPGEKLAPVARPDGGPGLLYPVHFRIVALDRATGNVRTIDTTRIFLTRDTLRRPQNLSGTLELPVEPGTYDVRILLQQPGRPSATGVGRDTVALPRAIDDLAISDMVLGRSDLKVSFQSGTERVPVNPLNAFLKGSQAEIYYELVGLAPGRRYVVSLTVHRAEDAPTKQPRIRLSFETEARGTVERIRRTLALSDLKAGNYRLTVQVEDKDGQRVVERSVGLNVVDK